ncbi:hypothetical protein ACQ4LE_006476 [Meloidogyne hapla]
MVSETTSTQISSSSSSMAPLPLLFISALLFAISIPLGLFLCKIMRQIYINRFEKNMEKQLFCGEREFIQQKKDQDCSNKSIGSLEEWI